MEMAQITNAVLHFMTMYGKTPVDVTDANTPSSDFTYGVPRLNSSSANPIPAAYYREGNSELMAILMDLEAYRNGQPTVNAGHRHNPGQRTFLDVRQVKGTSPGQDEHGIYRDPWGNPYVITIDLNGDSVCNDPLYGKVPGRVFVWSAGPDGKADLEVKPGEGVNADNLLLPETTTGASTR